MQTKKELMAKIEELQSLLDEAYEEIGGLQEPELDSLHDDYE